MFSRVREWLAERFGTRPVRQTLLIRRVPKEPWYYGGGMALMMLLGIQVLTGIFLTLSYSPSTVEAYDSVRYITFTQTLGWFVRGMHYWSGGMMVVMLVYHMFRQIAIGGYKHPREGTWLVGVVLFFLVITTSYIGYVLRWDERAIYALRISLYMFQRVPIIGEPLVLLVLGGPTISTLTLTRLYSMHVIIIPLLLLALVGHHMYLVILHGTTALSERKHPSPSKEAHEEMYKREKESPTHGETFYPRTIVRLMPIPAAVFILVLVLTLVYRGGRLFPEANLTATSFPHEEWWWAWYSSLAALLPPWIAPTFHWVFPIALFLLLMGLPFIDRGPSRGLRHRPIAVTLVLLTTVGILYLSGLRRSSPWTAWPDPTPPPVPEGIVLAEGPERGRHLFVTYGCNSCHAVAGHGRPFAPDLAGMRERYSADELRRYILNPPAGVAMPAYEGHITEEDLQRIVEYVLVAQTFPWRNR